MTENHVRNQTVEQDTNTGTSANLRTNSFYMTDAHLMVNVLVEMYFPGVAARLLLF